MHTLPRRSRLVFPAVTSLESHTLPLPLCITREPTDCPEGKPAAWCQGSKGLTSLEGGPLAYC